MFLLLNEDNILLELKNNENNFVFAYTHIISLRKKILNIT